ncbi:hypothetical protein PUMCH_003700 [Australozyma saopauloensis]|uniref:Arrestin-like N-terminal domain-containing protein n=1 Tax=Australozyma saopauloensis TaxID=291208 RepID=A0AAX4HD41_9ASCO|nr:hypothetical protein PUMCH_003700 [[Candida] saopauloensis]
MGLDVNVEIDRSRTGGTFTNHDVITGIVKLTNTSSLSLTYIQVKLEGLSSTQIVVPTRRNNKKKKTENHALTDVHKVLYDLLIVFPPENIRKVSLAKEFTLTPGTYTYPFLFKIPLKSGCLKQTGKGLGFDFKLTSNPMNLNVNAYTLRQDINNLMSMATQQPNQQRGSINYHVDTQLPPTLLTMGQTANIKYFVKVTCKRASIFKVNARAIDPFNFLPLDLDDHFQPIALQEEEYKEVYFRKDIVFKNRIPEVVGVKMEPPQPQRPELYSRNSVKKGFLSFFAPPSPPIPPEKPKRTNSGHSIDILDTDVNFAFEIRFRHPAFLSPTSAPRFKLFFVSNVDPSSYSLAKYGKPEESNGLGVIYLQRLKFDLIVTTNISVLETENGINDIHQSRAENTISVCNNSFRDVPLDLMHSKKQKSSSASSNGFVKFNSFELEIPKKYYDNFKLPRNLPPTFTTCNIERTYTLVVVAGVSSEKLGGSASRHEGDKRIRFVDLVCPNIKVLSGLKLTQALHSNASNPSVGHSFDSKENGRHNEFNPSVPPTVSEVGRQSIGSAEDTSLPLPTYEDVVRENSYQDDSEHLRARHRYKN